jgi:hypothetical protein
MVGGDLLAAPLGVAKLGYPKFVADCCHTIFLVSTGLLRLLEYLP